MNYKRLIVFDLDHTLLSCNSSFHFGQYLFRQKYFSLLTLVGCLSDYARHKYLGMPIQDLHENSFSRLFLGKPYEEICSFVDRFLTESLESLFNQKVLQRLKEAQRTGQHVLVLSSSPDFLVDAIAKRLSVPMSKATCYDVCPQGRFSGISHVLRGEDKAEYVTNLSKSLSLPLGVSHCLFR